MERYYTPKIEELFIGYKCQNLEPCNIKSILNDTEDLTDYEWRDCIFNVVNLLDIYIDKEIDLVILENKYRTKYLDKSDIKSLGFKSSNSIGGIVLEFYIQLNTSMYLLNYNLDSKQLKLFRGGLFREQNLIFKGKCKSINELEKIIQQTIWQ